MARRKVLLDDVIAVVLAGGQGERLYPLTRDRSKPAVPFGSAYRIIDFTLANCLHSGIRRVLVLTQYKSRSLSHHIQLAWNPIFSSELGEWIQTIPPQQLVDDRRWYEGTADAVYHNVYLIEQAHPRCVVVLSTELTDELIAEGLATGQADREEVLSGPPKQIS